jgi:hypothetical protein
MVYGYGNFFWEGQRSGIDAKKLQGTAPPVPKKESANEARLFLASSKMNLEINSLQTHTGRNIYYWIVLHVNYCAGCGAIVAIDKYIAHKFP